jgi:type IV secretory pathway VirB10-like protein
MTFDPESLYARPAPGRGVRPVMFVAGGAVLAGTVLAIVTAPYWWPESQVQVQPEHPIRSYNSNTATPPLNFPGQYSPAVYSPPPPPAPAAPAATPAPATGSQQPGTPAGPPKMRGIPQEERKPSVVLDGVKGGGSAPAAVAASGPVAAGGAGGGIQQVAGGTDREKFYSSAGASSNAFRPTGIVGQLGRCTLRPGAYIFHEAAGVVSSSTPGQITARTSRPIYAGPKGDCYASPAGATLVGTLNSNTAYGDDRIQVAWTALILPNGRMVDLGGMPGAGGDGATGLPSDVDNHFGALAGAVLVGTVVDVIRSTASFGNQQGDVVISMGQALADRRPASASAWSTGSCRASRP